MHGGKIVIQLTAAAVIGIERNVVVLQHFAAFVGQATHCLGILRCKHSGSELVAAKLAVADQLFQNSLSGAAESDQHSMKIVLSLALIVKRDYIAGRICSDQQAGNQFRCVDRQNTSEAVAFLAAKELAGDCLFRGENTQGGVFGSDAPFFHRAQDAPGILLIQHQILTQRINMDLSLAGFYTDASQKSWDGLQSFLV